MFNYIPQKDQDCIQWYTNTGQNVLQQLRTCHKRLSVFPEFSVHSPQAMSHLLVKTPHTTAYNYSCILFGVLGFWIVVTLTVTLTLPLTTTLTLTPP